MGKFALIDINYLKLNQNDLTFYIEGVQYKLTKNSTDEPDTPYEVERVPPSNSTPINLNRR